MQREYEIFEQLADGSLIWRGHASGLASVRQRLEEVASQTKNECFAIHLLTKDVVARLNLGCPASAFPKRTVFQIAYDSELASRRAAALRAHGYEVVSVIGNEAAKLVLTLPQNLDAFLIGHAAPEDQRKEMVAWLKARYPAVRVVALNSPTVRELSGADYNSRLNGPETWLPFVAMASRNQSQNRPSL